MTAQIANTINDVLKPQGVGVIIKATHHCRPPAASTSRALTSSPAACWAASATTR